MKKDPTEFRKRFAAWKDGKDPYRYLYDDQTGKWNRITNNDVADVFADFVATPQGNRNSFSMYENTTKPVVLTNKNEVVVPDNTLWTRQQVEKTNNVRTWRSDAADIMHSIGEGALMSTMFMDPAIEPLLYPTYQLAKNTSINLAKNIAGRYIFLQRPNSFTRGIGGEAGLQDLIESGLIRGNPVGTEMSAHGFAKAYRRNRDNFRDIMDATGREGIAQRYYNRTLTEDDFNAIKQAAAPYVQKWNTSHKPNAERFQIALGSANPDPLSEYSDYAMYQAQLASDRQTLKAATSLDESGQPLAYFYDDGRNPLTAGHDYAASRYGVRINNASDYNPRIFDGHLHYSMPRAVSLDDPNVEVFKQGPFGITIKIPKNKLKLRSPKSH